MRMYVFLLRFYPCEINRAQPEKLFGVFCRIRVFEFRIQVYMPPIRSLLIFDLSNAHFGVDATLVRESVWLPELTPVEEAPFYVVGMFSLRNQLVPVTDLNLRFGHPSRPCGINDQIVVLEKDKLLMGVIVSEVREVIEVSPETILPPPKFHVEFDNKASLIEGEIRVGDDLVTLLNTNQLVGLPLNLSEANPGCPARSFCPEAPPEHHAVYRARAKALMEDIAPEEGDHVALAVVELDEEYFGVELDAVQEFCEIAHISPIPCCPKHILGAINLRGNLLTLLDLRAALNLPPATQISNKAVVARLGEHAVGVSVDEVHDVIYLRQEEIQAAPAMLREQSGAEIKGAVHYAEKMMVVLDLPALLAREEWIVNESV